MKIAVLKGHPRKSGNSDRLAYPFIKGAGEAGHDVVESDCTQQRLPRLGGLWTAGVWPPGDIRQTDCEQHACKVERNN